MIATTEWLPSNMQKQRSVCCRVIYSFKHSSTNQNQGPELSIYNSIAYAQHLNFYNVRFCPNDRKQLSACIVPINFRTL